MKNYLRLWPVVAILAVIGIVVLLCQFNAQKRAGTQHIVFTTTVSVHKGLCTAKLVNNGNTYRFTDIKTITDGQTDMWWPRFSPDGKKIVCMSSKNTPNDHQVDICLMDADGSHQRLLAHNSRDNAVPVFSPDGKKIVFTSNRDSKDMAWGYSIYAMNADGSDVQRLTHCTVSDMEPTFTPDGKSIVYISRTKGRDKLFVMNADGSNQRKVTDELHGDLQSPVVTPDGKQVLVLSRLLDATAQRVTWGINVVNLDDGRSKPFPVEVKSFALGPYGDRLLYTSNEGLHSMNFNGTQQSKTPMYTGKFIGDLSCVPYPEVKSD